MEVSGCGSVVLQIPEVHGSNPAISKNYIEHWFTVNCTEKTKIKPHDQATDV